MIIAVDFDGTIVEHAYPAIGKPIPFAIETSSACNRKDTASSCGRCARDDFQEALTIAPSGPPLLCRQRKLSREDRTAALRKLTADLFIDDRNLGASPTGHDLHTIQAMERHQHPPSHHVVARVRRAAERKKRPIARLRRKNKAATFQK